jgi:hypothetical protein
VYWKTSARLSAHVKTKLHFMQLRSDVQVMMGELMSGMHPTPNQQLQWLPATLLPSLMRMTATVLSESLTTL